MRHFLSTIDWSREELDDLLKVAAELKQEPVRESLKGRSIALMFLNPSMRTRTSKLRTGELRLAGMAKRARCVTSPGSSMSG